MSNPSDLNRRQLMASAALAVGAATANSASAQAFDAAPDLSGKSVLITGSSSGFGRLGAEYYARLGAKVFATMRNLPRTEASELEALAEAEDLDITVIEIDVTSDEQVETGVAKALELAGGTLDVLVNNAGLSTAGPIEAQDIEATKLLFDTNVFGPQRMMRAVMPSMRKAKQGQIFNVTSQLGRLVIPGFGQYSPTKFALEAMSEQFAYEVVQHGVDVTMIQPGGYPTKIWDNQVPLSAALRSRLPEELLVSYPQLTARMAQESGGGGGSTDPMDVPIAIAEIIAMPRGKRPLRRPVHPGDKPQIPINEVSAKQQIAFLGESSFGPWIKDALD